MSSKNSSDTSDPENFNKSRNIPKWNNADYFHPILQKDVKDFDKITSFSAIAATQPGDNYCSVMIRMIVDIELKDGSKKKVSYILKTMLESDTGKNLDGGLFLKEKQTYQKHIPNFIRLYREAGVDIELAPKCVHIDESSEKIILVLEDLKQQKFENVDRLKGLDMEHMRRVLHKVAEFHAASAVAREQNGDYDQMYYAYDEVSRSGEEKWLEMESNKYIKAMREWKIPDVDTYIAKLLPPTKIFDIEMSVKPLDETEFNVLNHGDLWCNNIMFSGDRTLLVDYQLGKWGSPAQDLWYLIMSSASLDIKIKEFDHFIQIYHSRLVECLKLLKYSKPIPTLRELHMMMIKYGDWGLLAATGVLRIVVLPHKTDVKLEGETVYSEYYSNPNYVKAMAQLFPFLNNKGLLDSDT